MHWILFASLFSFVYYVGLQWWHYLTTIQQRVGFVLLTCILKSSRPTFTFWFFIYFDPRIYFCFLYNCLSKLDTHVVCEDKNKTRTKQKKSTARWFPCVTRLTETSCSRQLTCAQWSRTIFWQKSYQTKRSFKLTSSTSSHLFPLRYQQRGPWHFSATQTIDFRIFKYQFSVVAYLDYLATILRIKSPVQKF